MENYAKSKNDCFPALIKNEITNELKIVGDENFKYLDKLAIGKFDSTVYQHTTKFLSTLKKYYSQKLSAASAEKEKRIAELTDSPAKAKLYESRKNALRKRCGNGCRSKCISVGSNC